MKIAIEEMIDECEAILIESKRYNIEHHIWPSDVITIDYLLTQSEGLKKVYAELAVLTPQQRAQFIDQLISTISHWSPSDAIEMRAKRNRLVEINSEVSKLARSLAILMEERSTLENKHPFTSHTHYHVVDLIKLAAKNNYSFRDRVSKPLEALATQFDFKYWPELPSIIHEIANDAAAAKVKATDERTEASIASNRSSKADFARALLSMIEDLKYPAHLYLPPDFCISDAALADLMNICLKLDVNEMVDATYVKNLRHRKK